MAETKLNKHSPTLYNIKKRFTE